jgi:hypothetical protein
MLVTVAMLVIIMTILVQVFQGATGALSAAQATQELDNELKLLDATIRQDLNGATAKFTPPLDPAQNLGYFEYGENEFADIQGEDSDDYIRFTAQAPPGRPFTGRMWVSNTAAAPAFYNGNSQPVTITSEYAEIIYFLRNGNLYRRVLLVAPQLQSSITAAISNQAYLYNVQNTPPSAPISNTSVPFTPSLFHGGVQVSWQGVNDLSARPAASGPNSNSGNLTNGSQALQTIVLNTLGDLTNRENRFAYSRFANDFMAIGVANGGVTYTNIPDGIPDDVNSDNVPDYYPTLYPRILPSANNAGGSGPPANQLVFEPNYGNFTRGFANLLGFPFVFPGAYSVAQQLQLDQYGWIHAPAPSALFPQANGTCEGVTFDGSPLTYLQNLNHNPLDVGDNLPTLTNVGQNFVGGKTGASFQQTWWGFPTWRETLSPAWTDPTVQVNVGAGPVASNLPRVQPPGLVPLTIPEVSSANRTVNNFPTRALLPPMSSTVAAPWRTNPELQTDGWGDDGNGNSFFYTNGNPLWSNLSWEDDLIMTGVRSFDIKAYDNALAGYGDLGWGDDLRLYVPYSTYQNNLFNANNPAMPTLNQLALAQTPATLVWPPLIPPAGSLFSTINQTFAHEGRIPPLVEDLRFDAQWGAATSYLPSNSNFLPANGGTYSGNIGDDNPGIVRLRRVWDSWSTEYSKAPSSGVYPDGSPAGPLSATPPIYPSYPPPYPAPLRGIQIQIRVVDPTNSRVKSITIRQDFTDKL